MLSLLALIPIHSGLPGDSMGSPSLGPKKQAMLSFKQFLTQQDDSIDESKAIQLYQEYKTEFKRKQIIEFFDEHKEEDWYELCYIFVGKK